ncbi:hypothetical protein [Mesorhizobium sp. Root157]|uniref:hypothetical protein n=1 Tax=Mesorhizobium sp. Root157 TaxID=1736477 RepID=UPI000A67687D|nr:hypothetical protein [Mesorhizobium sp. Root157]
MTGTRIEGAVSLKPLVEQLKTVRSRRIVQHGRRCARISIRRRADGVKVSFDAQLMLKLFHKRYENNLF